MLPDLYLISSPLGVGAGFRAESCVFVQIDQLGDECGFNGGSTGHFIQPTFYTGFCFDTRGVGGLSELLDVCADLLFVEVVEGACTADHQKSRYPDQYMPDADFGWRVKRAHRVGLRGLLWMLL